MEELDPSVAVPLLFIGDSHVRRRGELRRFFSSSGFRVLAARNGLECLAELGAMETDVLVIALEIPWGGGDGVIARLKDGPSVRKKPLIFVIGDAPADTLSARTGVAPRNCFSTPLRKEDLLDRIGMEFGMRLLRGAEDRQWPSQDSMRRALLEESVR
ncbi:MAG: response regulator [Thermoguttaceae bacterium]